MQNDKQLRKFLKGFTSVRKQYSGFIPLIKKCKFWHLSSVGDFRKVYHRGNVVIKIPRNFDGVLDNIMEAKAWQKYKNSPTNRGIYLAPCKLLPNKSLMMAFVDVNSAPKRMKKLPKWLSKLDNYQAGCYKNRMVAYDYALNLDERLQWERDLGVSNSFYQKTYQPNEKVILSYEPKELYEHYNK